MITSADGRQNSVLIDIANGSANEFRRVVVDVVVECRRERFALPASMKGEDPVAGFDRIRARR